MDKGLYIACHRTMEQEGWEFKPKKKKESGIDTALRVTLHSSGAELAEVHVPLRRAEKSPFFKNAPRP